MTVVAMTDSSVVFVVVYFLKGVEECNCHSQIFDPDV